MRWQGARKGLWVQQTRQPQPSALFLAPTALLTLSSCSLKAGIDSYLEFTHLHTQKNSEHVHTLMDVKSVLPDLASVVILPLAYGERD